MLTERGRLQTHTINSSKPKSPHPTMDFLKDAASKLGTTEQQGRQGDVPGTESAQQTASQQSSDGNNGGGFLGGITDKLNSAAGGGRESEKNEDALDKGIDYVQEKFLGQGPQDNESAVEQAKDEQISDFIRGQYKGTTGKDFPVSDKDTKFS
jgi:hypothetical protein